jgi:hypothetical protein
MVARALAPFLPTATYLTRNPLLHLDLALHRTHRMMPRRLLAVQAVNEGV